MSCLRRTGSIFAKTVCSDGQTLPAPLQQFVRGIKPRWLPKSKSKIFYVREPTPIDPVEHEELRTMYFHYRTKLRAIRGFLRTQYDQKMAVIQKQSAKEDRDNIAEFQAIEGQVSQWNSRVQKVREELAAMEEEKRQQRAQWWQEREERRKQKQLARAQRKVVFNLEESKSFITLDTLDTEIEKMLNLRQDYNFAIDKQGNRIESDSAHKTETSQADDKANQQEAVKR
ncbi:small ribosomal subunit protein mS26-like [Littorina saxatilis]|uniref:Small ribosomal subunit protein mS26 n=1 Tax=Littorina saxatilis TaxID=31220 RepID=A0AAN9BRZ5_9CAEN